MEVKNKITVRVKFWKRGVRISI